jgi:hypothetical protein
MNDPTPQETPDPPADKLDQAIERVMQKTLGRLLDSGRVTVAEGGKSAGRQAEPQIDVAEQVRQALVQAKEEDRRTAGEKARDERIAKLEDMIKNREQAPREHRPITALMGWIHKDDVPEVEK